MKGQHTGRSGGRGVRRRNTEHLVCVLFFFFLASADDCERMRASRGECELGTRVRGRRGSNTTLEENKLSVGLIYVNEKYDGWREQCLRVLQTQFEPKSCSFASDEQIIETLKNYSIGQDMDLKQIQKLCMPFIKFKKDEAQKVGLHALELKLPFSELEVLTELRAD